MFTGKEIVCQLTLLDRAPLVLDLEKIRRSEVRQDEVATVTKFKAPELLAEFNRSWRELNELIVQIKSERIRAMTALDQRRSVLLLDEVNDILKLRKVSSSADTREAAIVLDPQHMALAEVLHQIESIVEFLQGKAKSFENAYTSVKKILQEEGFTPGANPALSGTTDSHEVRAGFGRARY